ncbi:hypothetical protein AMECASPLE_014342 [Ameca splendens]|uniref:Uncharacterized protein n=1 Tax=Ameca splendens TaxID=208324 RepID=A0ABV0XQG4_9TELE
MGREGLGVKMLSQGASSPADPKRHPCSPSSNKGQRHRHIHRAKGQGQGPGLENRPKTRTNTPSSPPEPSKSSNPDPQPQHPVPRPKEPPTPDKKEPAISVRSIYPECGPTTEKEHTSRPSATRICDTK